MHHLNFGSSTRVGNVRSHNEDSFRAEPELGLWIVADGMGGHKGGATASAIAADFVVEKIRAGDALENAIAGAHHAVLQASRDGKGPEGMGTTIVALGINGHACEIAWVGDCRAYLWDGATSTQLTRDHSYVQHLVDTGVISSSESARHPYQDILIQALGAADIPDVNVEKITRELYQNEQILLCSDGLTKELSDKDIADVLAMDLTEQERVDFMTDAALKNGGRDNITVILVSADPDAPVRLMSGDTQPMNMEELKTARLKPTGFPEKLRDWFKATVKVFFSTR